VQQRISGVPLAYLTGRQRFMGLEMMVGPEAVIPRKETEILGQAALHALSDLAEQRGQVRAIDVCTGSGNLALALAFHEPRCTVVGVDLSPAAAALANRNALALDLSGRVTFTQGDLFAPFESDESFERVDMVTCNPPYISAARLEKMPKEIIDFEPRMAFDGGPFGVNILTRLIRETPRYLKPNSWLCFEVGLGQGPALERMLQKAPGYAAVQAVSDEQGEVRALLARTRPADNTDLK
jgi:release factor glutamine methyltransferase